MTLTTDKKGGIDMEKADSIEINGKEYVLASSVKAQKRESIATKKYVIVRTYSAGVFAGRLKSRVGQEVTLQDARRLWYWEGAFSLSEMAMRGTTKPDKCKFAVVVDEIILTQAIEIMPCTEAARKSIESVKEMVV